MSNIIRELNENEKKLIELLKETSLEQNRKLYPHYTDAYLLSKPLTAESIFQLLAPLALAIDKLQRENDKLKSRIEKLEWKNNLNAGRS